MKINSYDLSIEVFEFGKHKKFLFKIPERIPNIPPKQWNWFKKIKEKSND